MSKHFLFIFLFTNFLLSQTKISLPTEYIRQDFDVLNYEATFDFRKFYEKKLEAICKINFLWVTPDERTFYFHLRDLTVDSVFYNSKKVVPTFEKNDSLDYSYYALYNLFGDDRDTNEILIFYSGALSNEKGNKPFGGVFLADSVLFSIGVGFNNDYVSATQHWLACYDHPSDKANFKFIFIVPEGFKLATNGKTKHLGRFDNNSEIWVSTSDFPIATYLLTFAVGKFKTMQIDPANFPHTFETIVYFPDGYETQVQWAFRNFSQIFYCLQSYWGKYPFDRIGYVIVPPPYNGFSGAMEHQMMITLPTSFIKYAYDNRDTLTVQSLLLHELAHQWFGNSVTPLDFRDAWFNEAFTTFSELLYLEWLFGKEKYLQRANLLAQNYVNSVSRDEGLLPLYNYSRKSPSSNYPRTIYIKGAIVVAMLRDLLGDKLFFDLLRNTLDYFAYRNISTSIFGTFCSNFIETSLYWFFEQWIFSQGYPILDVHCRKYSLDNQYSSVEIKIKQIQPSSFGKYSHLPIELNFHRPSGTTFDTVVILEGEEKTFWLDSIPNFNFLRVNQGKKIVSLAKTNIYTEVQDFIEKAYPFEVINVDKSFLTLKINEGINPKSLIILDIFGKVVKKYHFADPNNFVNIDISDLPAGVYLIQVESLERNFIRKFINLN
ncbi:MAG: M1 family aminopeptidase [Ignavibacteria bacterium]|nr:M1 family aminopeptidase [Ignavibacteria bacterium]